MKSLLCIALLFLGVVAKGASQEVDTSLQRTDHLTSQAEHETYDDEDRRLTARKNIPLENLPRRHRRPITRPLDRPLKDPSQDKTRNSQRITTHQERIQKYFRQAAQRQIASGIVLPRRRGDTGTSKRADLPPPQRPVTTPAFKSAIRDTQVRKSGGTTRDSEGARGTNRQVTRAPRLLVTKFHGPVKSTQKTSYSRRQGIHSDEGSEKNQRTSVDQVLPVQDEGQDSNPETAEVEVTQKVTEASQGTVDKIPHRRINQAPAERRLGGIRGRLREQGPRSKVSAGEDESTEQVRRVTLPFRRKRLRLRRPMTGTLRKVSRLIGRQNLPSSIKEQRPSGSLQKQPLLVLQTENQQTPVTIKHSSTDTAEESVSNQEQQTIKQISYLPQQTQVNDDSSSTVQQELSDDKDRGSSGQETSTTMTLDMERKDTGAKVGQQRSNHNQNNDSDQDLDHKSMGVRHQLNTPEGQLPQSETSPGSSPRTQLDTPTSPDTALPLIEISSHGLPRTPSTSVQNPSHASETNPSRSLDDLRVSTPTLLSEIQDHLSKSHKLHRQSTTQQEISNRRRSQSQQKNSQDLPRLQTTIIHRFSQSPQRASQPQKLMPVRQPHTENFPISQAQTVASGYVSNDSSIPQTHHDLHNPQPISSPQDILEKSTRASAQQKHSSQVHKVHFTSQSSTDNFSDLPVKSEVTRSVKRTRIMPVSLRVYHRSDQATRTVQHDPQATPQGDNRRGVKQSKSFQGIHVPITVNSQSQDENTQSISIDNRFTVSQVSSPRISTTQPSEVLLHTQQPQQNLQHHHGALADASSGTHSYATQVTHSKDSGQTTDIHTTHISGYTPTQATHPKVHLETSSTQRKTEDRNQLKTDDGMGVTSDDFSFLEGAAVVSLLSADHMGLTHTPLPVDTKAPLTKGSEAQKSSEGHLVSTSQTQTSETQRNLQQSQDYSSPGIPLSATLMTTTSQSHLQETQGNPHQHSHDFSSPGIQLHNTAGPQRTTVNRELQELHRTQSRVADLISSLQPHETILYGQDSHQSPAEAYLLHLKKLEAELEHHVSRLRESHLRFRQLQALRQGGSGSHVTGAEVQNYRHNETSEIASHTSNIANDDTSIYRSESGRRGQISSQSSDQISEQRQSKASETESSTSNIREEQVVSHMEGAASGGTQTSSVTGQVANKEIDTIRSKTSISTGEQLLDANRQNAARGRETQNHSLSGDQVLNLRKGETSRGRTRVTSQQIANHRQTKLRQRGQRRRPNINRNSQLELQDEVSRTRELSQVSTTSNEELRNQHTLHSDSQGEVHQSQKGRVRLAENSSQRTQDSTTQTQQEITSHRIQASTVQRTQGDTIQRPQEITRQTTQGETLRRPQEATMHRTQTATVQETQEATLQRTQETTTQRIQGDILEKPQEAPLLTQGTSSFPWPGSRVWRQQISGALKTSQEPTAAVWPGSRTWRQQLRGRTGAGGIRLRKTGRRTPLPPRISPLGDVAVSPHLRQHHGLDSWPEHPIQRPLSLQGAGRLVQSSRDQTKKSLRHRTRTPQLTSSPQRAAQRTGNLIPNRHQSGSSEALLKPLRVPGTLRKGRQRQLIPQSRVIQGHQNLNPQQAYIPQGTPTKGHTQGEYYYNTDGNFERSRALQRPRAHQLRVTETGLTRAHEDPRTQTTELQKTRTNAQARTSDQGVAHTHRGNKNPWEQTTSFSSINQRGSRKFLDTLRDRNDEVQDGGILKSLTAFLRGEDFSGHWITQNIPYQGTPTPQDFQIPQTNFRCEGLKLGYYADTHRSSQCRSFHFCGADGTHTSFMCPTGTAFSQRLQVCDHAFRVECSAATANNNLQQHPDLHQSRQHHHLHDHHHHHDLYQYRPSVPDSTALSDDRFDKRTQSQDIYHLRTRA